MKRLPYLLGCIALCCVPTAQGNTNKTTLTHIHQQLNTLRQQQQATKTDQQHTVDALRASEQAISHINRAMADIQQQQQSTQDALTTLQQQIGNTQSRLRQEQRELGTLLRQSWMGLDSAATAPPVDSQTNQRNLIYTKLLAQQRQRTIAELQDTTRTLAGLSAQKLQLQTQLQQQQNQQEQQRKNLQAERATRQKILQKLGEKITRQQQAISTLEQNERRINELMQALARAAAKRAAKRAAERAAAAHLAAKRAAERAAQAHRPPVSPSTSRPRQTANLPAPSLPVPNLSLSGLMLHKGHLILPTKGELIHRFGTPREAGGTLWKGLFIKAPAGQPVVSVAAGEVVFADWLRGFGNLIIIDHGAGYMSLYSDNETLYKRAGDAVKAGDIIASVGNTGGNNETGLYFELRYHSQAFNPDGWFGAHE